MLKTLALVAGTLLGASAMAITPSAAAPVAVQRLALDGSSIDSVQFYGREFRRGGGYGRPSGFRRNPGRGYGYGRGMGRGYGYGRDRGFGGPRRDFR